MADKVIDIELAPKTVTEAAHSQILTVRIGSTLEEVNRRLIEATLADCGNVKRKTTEILDISLKTLYNRLAVYNDTKSAAEPDPGAADGETAEVGEGPVPGVKTDAETALAERSSRI